MRRGVFAKQLLGLGSLFALALSMAHAADPALPPALDFESIVQNRWKGVIPFPPQKIVEDLVSLSPQTKLTSTVFPHGRSPERFFTTDEANPRSIFTWRLINSLNDSDAAGVQSNVYIAYTPLKHELEVIEWNPKIHQFDFKLVENYQEGKPGILQIADKSACMTCHQRGQPIFPIFPWSESAETSTDDRQPFIASMEANPNLDPFAKFLIQNVNSQMERAPSQMDPLIRISDERLYALTGCTQACGDNIECRRTLIKTSIFQRFDLCPAEGCATFDAQLAKLFPNAKPDDPVDNDRLVDRDPTSDLLGFTSEEDPLSTRNNFTSAADFAETLAFVDAPICFPLGDQNVDDLRNNPERTLKLLGSSAMTALLKKQWPPSPAQILSVLGTAPSQESALQGGASIDESLPQPTLLKISDTAGNSCQKSAQLFTKYCATCHLNPGSFAPILPLESPGLLKNYVSVLSPDRTPLKLVSGSAMPPKKAPQPSAAERQEMVNSLQSNTVCGAAPVVPHALNSCIACHSGGYPNAPLIPFDDSKAFCDLIQTKEHDLLSEIQLWLQSDDPTARMPKDSAPLSKTDQQEIESYLSNACR